MCLLRVKISKILQGTVQKNTVIFVRYPQFKIFMSHVITFKKFPDKSEPNEKMWVFAGYIFSMLGGFLGILIGYMLWTSQKTLPDRKTIYTYNKKSRAPGFIIFCIGIFMSAFYIVGIIMD